MTMTRDTDTTPTPWHATAAYLYALELDGPELAWEYLRRHPAYRTAWLGARRRQRTAIAQRWGLRVDLDPRTDARDVHPAWLDAEDVMPHLRPANRRRMPHGPAFDLWDLPGRKGLLHGGSDLILSVQGTSHRLRVSLSPALTDGATCRLSVPLSGDVAAAALLQQALQGEHPAPAAQRVSRLDLLHMRGLQALDASQAGCSQRRVAEALFGADAVVGRWHADSELRAQVRHILSRAKALMEGGYLRLAGVRLG